MTSEAWWRAIASAIGLRQELPMQTKRTRFLISLTFELYRDAKDCRWKRRTKINAEGTERKTLRKRRGLLFQSTQSRRSSKRRVTFPSLRRNQRRLPDLSFSPE